MWTVCVKYLISAFVFALSLCVVPYCDAQDRVVTHVTLTYYHPVKSQCDDSPLVTADLSKINMRHLERGKVRWCAISRDLLWLIPMGSVVDIEGFGRYEVHDLMNKRYDHCIDILSHPKHSVRNKIERVKVVLVRKPSKKK